MTGAGADRGRAHAGLTGVRAGVDDLIRLRARAAHVPLDRARMPRSVLAGASFSRLRGRGMEYAESRTYYPGDDVRAIDWKVTARTGRAHTKLFREERERPVILAVDLSPSMFFGTRRALKSVVAVEAAALIAWAAVRRGDRIGALVLGERAHAELRPVSSRHGALAVLRALSSLSEPPEDAGRGGPSLLDETARRVQQVARPGSLVFVVSDFYDAGAGVESQLSRLRRHADVVALWVHDPIEAHPPPPGRYGISDGAARSRIDLAAPEVRAAWENHFEAREAAVTRLCERLGAPLVALRCGDDVESSLREGLGGPRAAA